MADAGYLTIGKVVSRLQAQYPDLSVSKVRYLEDEGLITPSRTPGGYRLYSTRDLTRLERILYLQKHRFLPLSVIKEELERAEKNQSASNALSTLDDRDFSSNDPEVAEKLHPIERVPELLSVNVSFIRQLSDAGVITLKRSPHGRDLIDGHDFGIIRIADELRHYGVSPKNLRQYVTAANRETPMFESSLVGRTRSSADADPADDRESFEQGLDQLLALTNALRSALIRKMVHNLNESVYTS